MRIKNICLCGIIAALYVALTLINPISWGSLQFRVANILCVLPFVCKKTASGILIGIAIANFFSPLGIVDVLFGIAAEGLAYLLTVWGPGKSFPIVVKVLFLSFCVAAIVGAELTMVYQIPYLVNFVSLFISTLCITGLGAAVMYTPPVKKIIGMIGQ